MGMTSEAAEGLQRRGLGFVGSDGEYACAFQLGQLDQVGAQSAAGAGDEDCFAVLNLGLFHGLDGDSDGTGEEAGLWPGDSGGNFDEAIFAHCNHLCHATLHAVSDGLGLWTEAFQALGARLAPTAGVGEEGDDGVSRAEGGDAAANLGHHAGDLVAGN